MKLIINEEKKTVVALGTFRGRKVKAIAKCADTDVFNLEKGKRIAKEKYRVREQEVKKEIHESNIRGIKNHLKWISLTLENEKQIVNNLNMKVDKMKNHLEESIKDIVNE